jgi:IS30 family transposase
MTRQQGVYDFNDTVAADLLTVHDVDGTAYEVLSLVCWGSRYHVAKILKAKSSVTVAKKFLRYWVNWAGSPKRLHYDCGGEFEGKFETMLERLNIESYVVPTDAAWQAGLGERHGGILKTMHRAIVHESSA